MYYSKNFETFKKIKFSKTFIIVAVVLLFVAIILANSIISVYENEYVFVKQFGKVEKIFDESGIAFKIPFLQQVERIPANIMVYDMPASEVITKDKKNMILDDYVLWQITDPMKFYKSLNTISEGEGRIDTIVFNALKNYISSLDQNDVIAGRSDGISSEVLPSINQSLKDYGIEIKSVEIKRLDLPDDNKAAVYNRMISERSQIAASYKAEGQEQAQLIMNNADKEASILVAEAEASAAEIIAQGESEYMRILAEAYSTSERMEFYEFIRSLDAMKIAMKGDKTVILPIDSPLTSLLMGYK